MQSRFPIILQKQGLAIDVPVLVDFLAAAQRPDGRIPGSPDGKADPWDHVEAAMGLSVGGAHERARAAFEWLRGRQLEDGSWYAAYGEEGVQDFTRETNHAAYVAAGLYHYYLNTGDLVFVRHMWPTLDAAMAFVLRCQTPDGGIHWALSPQGQVDRMALLTGCSSICLSLKCALVLARALNHSRPGWHDSLVRLMHCIRTNPQRFNMTKARFSMDWFYPVLCGAFDGPAGRERLSKYWKKFIVQNMGVRCVSDHPWVTVAESSELVLTLSAIGNHLLARIVFGWFCDRRFEDGTFWCGFTVPDMVVWPAEKTTWTNAAVLLAADALYDLTPAGRLFSHLHWRQQAL